MHTTLSNQRKQTFIHTRDERGFRGKSLILERIHTLSHIQNSGFNVPPPFLNVCTSVIQTNSIKKQTFKSKKKIQAVTGLDCHIVGPIFVVNGKFRVTASHKSRTTTETLEKQTQSLSSYLCAADKHDNANHDCHGRAGSLTVHWGGST